MIVGPAEEKLGGGGESYLASLKHSAKRANNRVTFAGPIFDAVELEQTFRGAKLFVYPSLAERGESFGLAPLEAMTHGCAVLVSKLECFGDFIRDGETGFVFDHRLCNWQLCKEHNQINVLTNTMRIVSMSVTSMNRYRHFIILVLPVTPV